MNVLDVFFAPWMREIVRFHDEVVISADVH